MTDPDLEGIIAWQRAIEIHEAPALARTCPVCHAPPGRICMSTLTLGVPCTEPHPMRYPGGRARG